MLRTDTMKKKVAQEVPDDCTRVSDDFLIVHTKASWCRPREESSDYTFEVYYPALWLRWIVVLFILGTASDSIGSLDSISLISIFLRLELKLLE
jgi:hypothetical protein